MINKVKLLLELGEGIGGEKGVDTASSFPNT